MRAASGDAGAGLSTRAAGGLRGVAESEKWKVQDNVRVTYFLCQKGGKSDTDYLSSFTLLCIFFFT